MAPAATFTIVPQGPFCLRETAQFGFGQREAADFDGALRLAFCLDDLATQAGAAVRQDRSGVHVVVTGCDQPERVRPQVARFLSLADDARGFVEVGQRDPVIGRLQAAAPGLRPPLFYSAYEAAIWAVLSARRSQRQTAQVRQRLSEAHGRTFDVAGQQLAALPTPAQMLAVSGFPGIPAVKLERMHAVARAALAGLLDTDRIRAADPGAAMAGLQAIPGIGPFYSALIVIRASGVRDVLAADEPKVREAARRLYGLAAVPTPAQFEAMAQAWRPWRTWAMVLMRAAASRVLPPAEG